MARLPRSADGSRPVSLFRNGRSQAVRIPKEFELPGQQAVMRREGDRLVIEPLERTPLARLLDEWVARPVDVPADFGEVADPAPRPVSL